MDANFIFKLFDQKLATHKAETRAELSDMRNEIAAVKSDLLKEITATGNDIRSGLAGFKTELEHTSQRLPNTRTVWWAVVTIIVAIIATLGVLGQWFSAGSGWVGQSVDRSIGAQKDVDTLSGVVSKQQDQLDQLDRGQEAILSILRSSEASK